MRGLPTRQLNVDFGLNWNDYGARFYDASRLQFTTIDPLADIYAFQSPFAYAANNPVKFRDFMGMGPEDWKSAGADGLSNEQWIAANRSADGNQNSRMNAARQGNRSEEAEYKRNQSRDVTDDDIAESYSPNWEATRVEDSQGNVMSDNCDCGCPGKPPCKGQTNVKMKLGRNGETAPLRAPYTGFWGNLDYFFNGGNENGYKYDKNGYPIFYAPTMGAPDIIGGPLKKGDKILKISQYLFNPKYFHRVIKPNILSKAGNFAKIVGNNPDISIKGTKILLSGTKMGGFAGKTFDTGLNILDFF